MDFDIIKDLSTALLPLAVGWILYITRKVTTMDKTKISKEEAREMLDDKTETIRIIQSELKEDIHEFKSDINRLQEEIDHIIDKVSR